MPVLLPGTLSITTAALLPLGASQPSLLLQKVIETVTSKTKQDTSISSQCAQLLLGAQSQTAP